MKRAAVILFWALGCWPQTEPPEALVKAREAYDAARAGNTAEAEARLNDAARLAPANPLYRSALGGLLERAGRTEEAIAAFGEAIKLDPANSKLRDRLETLSLNWGAQLARQQRFRAGLMLARETTARFPKSSPAWLMLGLFSMRNQENLAAVAAYRRALELDPQSAEASVGLGIAQSAAGLFAESQATFEAGLKRFPNDATHRQAYGVLLVKMAESGAAPYRRAAEMFEAALKLDPTLTESRRQLERLRTATQPKPAAESPTAIFRDVTAPAGIRWRHSNGLSAERYLIESTTGGVAFLDYDNDGLMDILLVNGKPPARHALYRNLGRGRFAEVWSWSTPFYGMGVAAADYDNDGFQDFYITGYPSGALYHNNGNGTFTVQPGVENQGEWGASAAWFDYDNDGRLDLFIASYAEFSFNDKRRCEFEGKPTYCAQTAYPGRRSRLYQNDGGGKFTVVPIEMPPSRALGVVAVDYDGDGLLDLFVACDATPNLLLHNRGGGRFEDVALQAEVAYNADGVARAGMGVDAGDVDGDGTPDFLVTNFDNEYHALYLNAGRLPFREATVSSRLARHSRFYTGWGVRLLDYDNDGDLDAFIVNGHLNEMISRSNRNVSYREPPLLLVNDGAANFTRAAGWNTPYLGRGMATGDFDNDGAVDAVFVSLNDAPVLLHNEAAAGRAWLGVRLIGTKSNRDAIGAKLTLKPAALTRWITGGGSFLASHDRRVVFGLNRAASPCDLEIRWPSGQIQTVKNLAPGRYHTITEP